MSYSVMASMGLAPIAHQNDLAHALREQISFAVTAKILKKASTDAALTDSVPQLPGRLYPTADQVRAARRAGHEIGSHGHLHFKRANIPVAFFRSDLERSSIDRYSGGGARLIRLSVHQLRSRRCRNLPQAV